MTQVDMAAYIALWKPAWDWILHVYAQGATRENTLETLRDYASLRPAAQAAGDGGGRGLLFLAEPFYWSVFLPICPLLTSVLSRY
jgi:hypothetical protein